MLSGCEYMTVSNVFCSLCAKFLFTSDLNEHVCCGDRIPVGWSVTKITSRNE